MILAQPTDNTKQVCPHVPYAAATALYVQPPRPSADAVPMCCPCCGLGAWLDDDDPEPMLCPCCDVAAIVDRRSGGVS